MSISINILFFYFKNNIGYGIRTFESELKNFDKNYKSKMHNDKLNEEYERVVIVFGQYLNDKLYNLNGDFNPYIDKRNNCATLNPVMYTPEGKDNTLICIPVYTETCENIIDIASAFITGVILNRVKELKFVLVTAYSDIKADDEQFHKSIKIFYKFISTLDGMDMINISKSVGIRVMCYYEYNNSDDETMDFLKKKMLEIIINEINTGSLTKYHQIEFEKVISNVKIEVLYSDPKKELEISQTDQLFSLVDKLQYLKKKCDKNRIRKNGLQIKLKRKVRYGVQSETFGEHTKREIQTKPDFLDYVENNSEQLQIIFQQILNTTFRKFYPSKDEQNNILTESSNEFLAAFYDGLFLEYDLNWTKITIKEKILKLFVQLLPIEYQESFFLWESKGENITFSSYILNSKLNEMIKKHVKYLKNQFEKFESHLENEINSGISKYYRKLEYINREDYTISDIDFGFSDFYRYFFYERSVNQPIEGEMVDILIGKFCSRVLEWVTHIECRNIFSNKLILEFFIQLLPEESREVFSFIRTKINTHCK